MTPEELENRLVDYASKVLDVVEKLPSSVLGKHMAGQMVRSCTSPALNYAEAQSAESQKDFVHKMKICLKELRETNVAMKIVEKRKLVSETGVLAKAMDENRQMIAIFTAAIKTSRDRINKEVKN